ncbi:hypothetical protein [Streptomyces sp. OK228]|uniref:hypothetical protein n=1 Tax=Streptomyces sp. OK228 TaxID=1882786 RepID=UPI00117FB73A|nr:hypothetical protein [Streptomyces sp. OK228]
MESAGEPSFGELGRERVDVGFGEPGGKFLRVLKEVQESVARWDERLDRRVAVRIVAGEPVHHAAEGAVRVLRELGVRDAGCLKVIPEN